MVFVLNRSKKPLDMISHAKARILLKNKQAVVHKIYPFTIRLKDNSCGSQDRVYTVKIDPGSKHTGVAVVDDKASKSVEGFQTGDMVKAVVSNGLKAVEYLGRVAVRSSGRLNIKTKSGLTKDIGYKYCHLIQRGDGYSYKYKERDLT